MYGFSFSVCHDAFRCLFGSGTPGILVSCILRMSHGSAYAFTKFRECSFCCLFWTSATRTLCCASVLCRNPGKNWFGKCWWVLSCKAMFPYRNWLKVSANQNWIPGGWTDWFNATRKATCWAMTLRRISVGYRFVWVVFDQLHLFLELGCFLVTL